MELPFRKICTEVLNIDKIIKIAAAYIRVSTDDQLELSPDSQKEKIFEYAVAHNMMIPEEYVFIEGERKRGLSGRSAAKRPQFQKMIAIAKEKPKPFDVILLWKFSRFARNIDEATYYKSVLRNKCGVDVISVSEPISEGMYGRLVEMIIEWSDEFYSYNLASEVRRGMSAKAKAGEFSSYAPFGYLMKDKKLIPDPEKTNAVIKIYEDYASGKDICMIADELNCEGFKTRYGNKINSRFIGYIIDNPIYKGYILFSTEGKRKSGEISDGMIYKKGIHEAIVDEMLWEKCNLRRHRMKENRRRRARKNEYSLRSLIFCSACGSQLTYSKNNTIQCSKYNRGICKISHSMKISYAETEVFSKLEQNGYFLSEIIMLSPAEQNEVLLEIIEKIIAKKRKSGYDFEIIYR